MNMAATSSRDSEWRGAIGISEHGVEGTGKIVGEGTAVVLFRHGNQAGQPDEEQQEELKGKSCSENPVQEASAGARSWNWPRFRKEGSVATASGPAMWIVDRGSRL